jgi:hypothetical protein
MDFMEKVYLIRKIREAEEIIEEILELVEDIDTDVEDRD